MNPREALLREMLATAKDRLASEGWSRDVNERAIGFSAAILVVDEWTKMSEAPQATKPESLVLGEASCEEKTS